VASLSKKQQLVVDAPLEALAVVACAGSGKTKTAVSRLAKIRSEQGQSRSHVALLSFSNVAVDTFKQSYTENALHDFGGLASSRVTIDTFDGFITSHILRPHAYRTMGCNRVPFLISGTEPFLYNDKFQYWYSPTPGVNRPVAGATIDKISVGIVDNNFEFSYRQNNSQYLTNNGLKVTKALGKIGAYTHELGKFWVLYTLLEQPGILRALANRYPHIIVDEAQDIGLLHQCILELLIQQGVKVSLIGDPNQAIYEFAGATGEFIKEHDSALTNLSFNLDLNYRSIPSILNVANTLAGRDDDASRVQIEVGHGAYYSVYDSKDQKRLVDAFVNKIQSTGLAVNNSAVLCRGNAGIDKLKNVSKNLGQGSVKLLAEASLERDANSNYQKSFQLVVRSIIGLLKDTPDDLSMMLSGIDTNPEINLLRKDIWLFVRSRENGLPDSSLKASSEWHAQLKLKIIKLLEKIEQDYGYPQAENIGNKLAKTKLIDTPLLPDQGLDINQKTSIRVDTVHQAKGESLDAVLYMAQKSHIEAMLNGVGTEVGRIGYVAVTRAKDLFVLGVPKSNLKEFAPRLEALGMTKWA
jgi:superfamily I DNA/RNA helicase